jgi:glutamyl-tRNA reductase
VKQLKAIAITHKKATLEEIGLFHIEDNQLQERLKALKNNARLEELMYLSTCNRVEFYFVYNEPDSEEDFLIDFLHAFNPGWGETQLHKSFKLLEFYEGEEAIRHLFNVASSLDSMVVGEREIITQVRNAYDKCLAMGLTGDSIRLMIKKTVEAAKEIYTRTDIASKPVSVVSLAYRKLRESSIHENSRIIFIGAGQTNTAMARFLKKNGFKNFVVFNRSVANGLALAAELKCELKDLKDIKNYHQGFDVIISCTASTEPIINQEIYERLLAGEQNQKIVVDLAIPYDFDKEICKKHAVKIIDINSLKAEAEANMREREKELTRCNELINKLLVEFKEIYRIRQVERAMSEVPQKIKEIKDTALYTVFAKDIEKLNNEGKEILEKVVSYLEKKYISVPMKMAKQILLEKQTFQNSEKSDLVK